MENSPAPGTNQTSHKAYAVALVAVILYVVNGLTTGEWADTASIAPALAVVVLPFVAWGVPNRTKENS